MTFFLSVLNTWAVFSILQEMPSLVMRYNMWNVIGAVAYSLFFALVESIIVFLLTSFSATVLHSLIKPKYIKVFTITLWPTIFLIILGFISFDFRILVGLTACLGLAYLLSRNEIVNKIAEGLLDRIVILGAIYLLVDFCSVLIVIIRNLF